ncbi:MAG: hypothetical protein E7G91_13445, partial [Serratia liquefaciens]|nr:hypothetical protein [Serratia liquefaciens]
FSHQALALVFTFFWVSFFEVITAILVYTYRQESVKTENLGKVMGITGTLFKIGLPFGLAASGYIVSGAGIGALFIACAVIQIAMGALCLLSPMAKVA